MKYFLGFITSVMYSKSFMGRFNDRSPMCSRNYRTKRFPSLSLMNGSALWCKNEKNRTYNGNNSSNQSLVKGVSSCAKYFMAFMTGFSSSLVIRIRFDLNSMLLGFSQSAHCTELLRTP